MKKNNAIISLFCLLNIVGFGKSGNKSFFDTEKQVCPTNLRSLNSGSDNIITNGVYFIKPYLAFNKCLDVCNAEYENDNPVILYDINGFANQRFVFEQSYDDVGYGCYYRLRPIESPEYYVSLKKNSSVKNLVLSKDNNYDEFRLTSDRFYFEYNSSIQAYRISTKLSEKTKYLCLQNNSCNNYSLIEEKSFNPSDMTFYWKLELSDSLNVDAEYSLRLSPHEQYWMNVTEKISCYYSIQSTLLESGSLIMELRDDNETLDLIGSAFSFFDFNENHIIYSIENYIDAFQNKLLYIYNPNNYVLNLNVNIVPKKRITINTEFTIAQDFWDNNMRDAVSPYVDNFSNMEAKGFYPDLRINMFAQNDLENDLRGKPYINSEMYFSHHHGNLI